MLFCFCRNRHFDGALRRIHGRNFQYGHGLDLVAFTIAPRIRSCRLRVSDQIENLNRSLPQLLREVIANTGSAVFNALWTQLHLPCLILPAGSGPDGLPVGVQLVGQRHDDARLLEVGLWVEHRLGQGDRP